VDGVILQRNVVKGTKDVFYYHLGVNVSKEDFEKLDTERKAILIDGDAYFGTDSDEYLNDKRAQWFSVYGKTNNSSIKCNVGDVLRVASEEVLAEKEKSGYIIYRGYISRCLEPVPEKNRSDEIKTLKELSKKEARRMSIEEIARIQQM